MCYQSEMAASVLCGSSATSLEFELEDKAKVEAAIRDLFGEPKVKRGIVASTVQIDREDFTYQSERDDPCSSRAPREVKKSFARLQTG
jgi:hypothetical protein